MSDTTPVQTIKKQKSLAALKGGVIVSVQATHGEPLNKPEYLCALAEAVLQGGACGLRMAQPDNLAYFRQRHPRVTLIGITKPEIIPEYAYETVYITPTFKDVESIASFCDVVAMDATLRDRPEGESLQNIVTTCREKYPDVALMADVATLEEGLNAERLGFDLISTTLSGYTNASVKGAESKFDHHNQIGPDFELLQALIQQVKAGVVLEGRLWEPSEVQHAFSLGSYAVVIGSAITRPHEITRRFIRAAMPVIST